MRLRTDHMQATAAAKAGLSVATARRIDGDPRPPSARKQRRLYRTRPDPLADLWEEVATMLSAAPGLRPITLFDVRIPTHSSRAFRGKAAGDSDASQPLIPTHPSHP